MFQDNEIVYERTANYGGTLVFQVKYYTNSSVVNGSCWSTRWGIEKTIALKHEKSSATHSGWKAEGAKKKITSQYEI